MADHSSARFGVLHYDPGNPEFPTLPDGIDSLHIINVGRFPGLAVPAPAPDERLEKHSADKTESHADWFLDGIWRQPNPVDFGNITAAKQRQVTLHNSSRTAVTLTAIDVSAVSGVSVVTPGSLPQTIDAFDTITVTFEASVTGDPAFDDEVQFTVDGTDLPVRMIGRRVIIFNTIPERPIRERVSWLTDNMISVNGKEQAYSLRRAPRSDVGIIQRFTDDEERTRQLALIDGAGFLRFGVQLWWQARPITSAALSTDTVIQVDTQAWELQDGRDLSFVLPDGSVLEAEVASTTISSATLSQAIGTALPAGTLIMPLQYGFLKRTAQIGTYKVNVEDVRVDFTLLEYADIGALDMAYFDTHHIDGLPIIKPPLAFEGNTRGGNLVQDLESLDSITGDQVVFRNEVLGRPGQQVLVHCQSMADQHAWRQFLHYIRGSWRPFYIPTGTNDLPLSGSLTLGGNTFTVPSMGLTSLLGFQAPKRDIVIEENGNRYYRRITNMSDNGTIETITLDSSLPGSGTIPADQVKVSWLPIVRLVGDVATFQHNYFGQSDLRFNVRGVIA